MRLICLFLLLLLAAPGCRKKVRVPGEEELYFNYGEQNFGASAADLLRADKYTSLIVEVQYMEGFRPDEQAMINLKEFLQDHLHKPGGVVFMQQQIPAVQDSVLTSEQVDSIRKVSRKIHTRNKRIAIYIVYTNGKHEHTTVLGHAFRNTCIVIYGKALKQHEHVFSFPTQTRLETTVLLHEMGHILGLVGKGSRLRSDHADSLHDAHCPNPNCVMYWNMSIAPEFGPLKETGVPFFDPACLRDLKGNGGR